MEISSENYQMMANHSLEDVLEGCTKAQQQQQQHQEKKPRPHPETALKCPRCDSTNTKFCYYNNYSLSQPRYFCKGCRRYWTQGGSLRNVPVGGGCRKNKKSSNSSSKRSHHQDQAFLTTNPNKLLTTLPLPPPPPPPPSLSYDAHDLTLAFATNRQFGLDDHDSFLMGNPNPSSSSCIATIHTNNTGYLDILRNTGLPSVYYGYGGAGNVEGVDGYAGFDAGLLGSSVATANTVTTASGSTTPSQDSCRGLEGGESSKVLMGLQWQLGGDGNMGLDSGRECWNGVGSSWHGLTNRTFI